MKNKNFQVGALVIGLLAPVMFPGVGVAQAVQGGLAPTLPSASAASYYYISKPGELTMQVNIWGFVEKPGRYEVPSSTDLVQLVSYAGGPSHDANMDDVRVTRILRREGSISRQQYSVNLEDLHKVEEGKLILYPGDTIFIDHTTWLTLRDVFGVVSTAALITAAVAQVVVTTRR